MSQEDAQAFIAEIGKSAKLQDTVNAMEGKGVLARLVELGAEHGFAFSEEEYRAAVVEMADGALSGEALDEVLRDAGFKS